MTNPDTDVKTITDHEFQGVMDGYCMVSLPKVTKGRLVAAACRQTLDKHAKLPKSAHAVSGSATKEK